MITLLYVLIAMEQIRFMMQTMEGGSQKIVNYVIKMDI